MKRLTRLALGMALTLAVAVHTHREISADQAATPNAGRPAAISGSVVDGGTGRPIAGAAVLLSSTVRGAAGVARVVSDDRGRFVFTGLASRTPYYVSATRFGYLEGVYDEGIRETQFGARIELAAGEWMRDVRLVLWRPGAIAGVVIDEAGEPVIGAFVRTFAEAIVGGRAQWVGGRAIRTDDRGYYRLHGLVPGRYIVQVPSVQASVPAAATLDDLSGLPSAALEARRTAGRPVERPDIPALLVDPANRLFIGHYLAPPPISADGRALAYPVTYFPSARTIATATAVDLGRGEERAGIDLALAPMPAVRVSGALQGPPDAEPGRMVVRLLPAGDEALGLGTETATALTTSGGAFTFLNVPPGAYTIIASRNRLEFTRGRRSSELLPAPGFLSWMSGGGLIRSAAADIWYSHSSASGSLVYAGSTAISVGDTDVTGVAVPLQRGVTMTGRIVFDGFVADPALRGVPTTISAEPAYGDATLGMPVVWASSTDRSQFRLTGLLAGEYALHVHPPEGDVKSIVWNGRDFAARPFDASAGQDFDDVVITLTKAQSRIAGTVRQTPGRSAASAHVIAFPAEPAERSGYGFTPRRIVSLRVSSSAAFDIGPLPAGRYLVVAVAEPPGDRALDPAYLAAAAATATRVVVAWGQTARVRLPVVSVQVASGR